MATKVFELKVVIKINGVITPNIESNLLSAVKNNVVANIDSEIPVESTLDHISIYSENLFWRWPPISPANNKIYK